MKLLILTQKVDINDDVLGFFHGWVAEFAKHCEKVTVICLFKGEYDLPDNVKVLSLGKEKSKCKLKYLFRFYKYIWQERKNYDNVFVHMNQVYVILGGIFWRILGKKIGLWYAHGHVPLGLKVSEKIVNNIFTSTKSGCRMDSERIKVFGQGIDSEKFKARNSELKNIDKFKAITVGRISPVKDYETLIKAIEILNKKDLKIKVDVIGGAGLPEQVEYLEKLKKIVRDRRLDQVIKFLGPIPNKGILDHYQSADLFVNMSHTGSLDKVILEAMACELPILTCNEALLGILGKYEKELMYKKGDSGGFAEKIEKIIAMEKEEREVLGKELRKIVLSGHSLNKLVEKIIRNYGKED